MRSRVLRTTHINGKDGVAGSTPGGGPHNKPAAQAGYVPGLLGRPEGRQLPFARDLPDRFVHCESVRAACRGHSETS